MRAFFLCAVLTLLAAPASAAEGKGTLGAARRLYEQGRYQDALPLLDELHTQRLPQKDAVEALKLHAFSLYMLSLHDDAKRVWLELLTLEPSFALDPNFDSPIFISFFERIKPPTPSKPIEAAPVSAPPPTPVEPPPPAMKERGCGIVLCLLPFGVGQFANDKPVKGTLFAALEAGFLATNIGLQLKRDADFRRTGTVDAKADGRAVVVQNIALGLFAGTLVFGVIDAFVFD